jgi:hypothetical protein
MTDTSMNGMFEPDEAGKALDLDGATVEETGPEDPPAGVETQLNTDGTPVGEADLEADRSAG